MTALWILSVMFNSMAVGASIVLNDWGLLSMFNLALIPLSAYMIARRSK